MHATKEKKRSDKEGFKITLSVKERGFHIQTIIMMAARQGRIGDKRRKLRERDNRRLKD